MLSFNICYKRKNGIKQCLWHIFRTLFVTWVYLFGILRIINVVRVSEPLYKKRLIRVIAHVVFLHTIHNTLNIEYVAAIMIRACGRGSQR